MQLFRSFLRPMLLALGMLGGLGLAGQAQAVVAVTPVLTSYGWSGLCSDCTSIGDPGSNAVSGMLVLQDYTPGDVIDSNNFVSFSYSGSNLVHPFTVDESSGVLWLAGGITPNPGPKRFEVIFGDGLHFQTQTSGAWSVCAPGPKPGFPGETAYYGGGFPVCDFGFTAHHDFGTSGSFLAAAVPEPAEWALLLAGLGVIGLARRRRGLPACA